MAKESSLLYYIHIAERKTDEFIPLSRVYSEMQTALDLNFNR